MNDIAITARSLLFLPADRLDRLDKALSSGAHMVIVDLEDAVAPEAKATARVALQQRWSSLGEALRGRIAVRVNAANTDWHADDGDLVEALAHHGLGAVMLAQTESSAQLAALSQRAADVPLLPLIESAAGLSAAALIARSPGVARLAFGHLDFQLDLGLHCAPDERELDSVRLDLVMASRRADLPGPLDGVTVNLEGSTQLELDTLRSRRFGFSGKLCIHPRQVETVNSLLGPTIEQVAWARRVLAAADERPAGAFQFEGAMIDAPVLARAQTYLQLQQQG